MEINIPLLLKYIKQNSCSATANVSIDTPDPCLIFILGDNHEGSRREYVDFNDLCEIWVLNDIVNKSAGEPSLVQEQLNLMQNSPTNRYMRPENIEKLIYGTLAKNIIQILLASHDKLYYPEIKLLRKHEDYFRNR